jgi:adenylate kinase
VNTCELHWVQLVDNNVDCFLQSVNAVVGESPALKVMIAGAPAAGKGTQCARIVEEYGLVHISVGDLLRAEVAAGTPAGMKAKQYMDNGDLVPNEVVVEMVKNKLAEPEVAKNGWLLDGYPRSAEQAEAIEAENIRPDVFLLINVPDESLVERVVGRRTDPETGEIYHLKFKPPPEDIIGRLEQRSDDTEEKVRRRLETYHKNVDAVVGYYKNELVDIDGAQDMGVVFDSIKKVINDAVAKKANFYN